MPKQSIIKDNIESGRNPSIRDKLEEQAWAQNPDLANRLNNRLEGGKRHYDEPPRTMRLQDRILITLGFVLLVLLVMRVEDSIADESWGLQMTDDSGVYTELAINTDPSAVACFPTKIVLHAAAGCAAAQLTPTTSNNVMRRRTFVQLFSVMRVS